MPKFYPLTVARTQAEANDTLLLELTVPPELVSQFKFHQGQYLTFSAVVEGQELRRSYSICAGVGEPLAVAIKKIPGGLFSNYAHAHFRPGETVLVAPPDGSFFTPLLPNSHRRYLCIAAGSGITPIISIIRSVLAREPQSEVTLIYGNRTSADIIFRESLLWLKNRHMQRFQWLNVLSREVQRAPVLNGRIDNKKGAELNRALIDIQGFDEFFLCGPQGLVAEVSRGLRGVGVAEEHIHYELFFASAEDARLAVEKHQARSKTFAGLTTSVLVKAGGREAVFNLSADGENILDGALHAGLDLPFSCKGGVCATCKAKLEKGQVDMDLNHALSAQQLAEGFILTCQSHPTSKEVVVDFDVI